MYVEIVTPEATLFKGAVRAITLPGESGAFQMLENHAPIVTILGKGEILLTEIENHQLYEQERFHPYAENSASLPIKGGAVEQKNNKTIVLVD